jgi:thiol-disulfide isomerase/thioredoxin
MSRAASRSARPDRRKLILWSILALVVIAAIVAVGLASRNVVPSNATKAVGNASIKVGDTAPEFTAQTNAGTFDLAGVSTPVLLEVFATWCPHCQHEATILDDVAAKYAGKLAIVAVSGDAFDMNHQGPETQADVNLFAQTYKVRYPIAFDPDLKVAQLYLKDGFPTIVLIDKNKKITAIRSGETPEAELLKMVKTAL